MLGVSLTYLPSALELSLSRSVLSYRAHLAFTFVRYTIIQPWIPTGIEAHI